MGNRGRIFIYLAFIIILGLVAVFVVWQRFLQPRTDGTTNAPVPTAVSTVNVVVTSQKVARGSLIDDKVIGVVPMPKNLFIQGMFSNASEVLGRQAKFDLDSGIPLTAGMLVDKAEQLSSTGSNAALSIPRGMVAVSIPIDRLSSVSYAPQSGDHVNVIVTLQFVDLDTDFQTMLPNRTTGVTAPGKTETTAAGTSANSLVQGPANAQSKNDIGGNASMKIEGNSLVAVTGGSNTPQGKAEADTTLGQTFYLLPSETQQRPRMATQTLLQDAVVLKMGSFPLKATTTTAAAAATPAPAIPGQPAPAAEPVKQEQSIDVVTLIVSPQDAVTLNYLMFGNPGAVKLTLALRSAGDDSRVQTEAATLQFLLDQYRIPVPVKLPYGVQPATDKLNTPVLKNDTVPAPTPAP